jgi:hypothetical protein
VLPRLKHGLEWFERLGVSSVARFGRSLLRYRYPVLAAWGAGWFIVAYLSRAKGLNDWLTFEFGARTIVHLNSHYDTGALSLYAHYPFIQIGPPPLLLVGALQWLRPSVVELIFATLMALGGIWCLRCVELAVSARIAPERRHALQVLLVRTGLVVMPIWAWDSARWQHLDDIMAITATMTAMAVIATGRRWWLAAVLIGLAVAAKPWALATAPCLLGLPREERAKASLLALIVGGACWGPFVLGNSDTVSALGNFRFTVDAGSTPHFLGMALGNAPRWIRPVQFVGGFGVAVAAVRQRRWIAVPLIGFAFRVVIDPQMWMYYGMGPLVAAALWDCAGKRKWPIWTALTALVEYAVPNTIPSWSGPVRLAWFLAILVMVLRPNHAVPDDAVTSTAADSAHVVPALA